MINFGLEFEQAVPASAVAQNRADVACFVGFVPRSERFQDQLPPSLRRWLREQGYIDAPGAPSADEVIDLLQIPVPIDDWSTFVELFDWRGRPISEDSELTSVTYLGAAVRSFFAQGGRKCYVVRTGDPLPLDTARSTRIIQIRDLLPQFSGDAAALSPLERYSWRGITHLYGLPEVSFVAFPDLPMLVAQELPQPPPDLILAPPREFFVECSESFGQLVSPPREFFGAPRCIDEVGYRDWSRAINVAARFLAGRDSPGGLPRERKDIQLIASVPLPSENSMARTDLLNAFLTWNVMDPIESGSQLGISSAHVQLAYPWISWNGSAGLPEAIEPAEGALTGLLARGVLLEGSFRSFADQPLYQVTRVEPELSESQMDRARGLLLPGVPGGDERTLALRQRVSLFGPTMDGFRLLSDVNTSADEAWRPGSVNRLMSVWVRALLRIGEDFVFETSNESTWTQIRHKIGLIGDSLYRSGALRGRSPQEAYEVRCDRSVFTSVDIDAGRIVAEVRFRPAVPIEAIRIAMALNEAQRVSVRQEVAA